MRPEFLLEADETEKTLPSENITTIQRKVVSLAVFFLLMFQTVFRLSDAAINVLFHFLSLYFKMLSKVLHCTTLQAVHTLFPTNVSDGRCLIEISSKNLLAVGYATQYIRLLTVL